MRTLAGLALGDIPARPWGSVMLALVAEAVKVKESAQDGAFNLAGARAKLRFA